MKKGLVSIIIPVYNVAKFLRTCLDSILAQSYQNYELILVDDGSTDGSGMICDEYHGKDNRIKVFHTSNHGVSHARNDGINEANGEFLFFIDSDDFIDANYLESYIQYKEYDCVIGSYQTFPIIHTSLHKEMLFDTSCDEQSTIGNYIAKIDGTSCCKLYQNAIIQRHQIRFKENMRFSEDTDFCLNYFRFSKTIKTISNNGYHYRVSVGNQAGQKYHLTKEEINHNLSILLNDYEELERQWGVKIDHSNFRIGVACYPIENIYSLQSDEKYYGLYYKFYYQADKKQFYEDPICSPYVRTITAIKSHYISGERKEGRRLIREFASLYVKDMTKIDYPYPFYKTFSHLIGHRFYFLADILFALYTGAKRILNK